MQEELKELLSGVQAAHLIAKVHDKWKKKAAEFIVEQELFDKPELIKQIVAINKESAEQQLQVISDNLQKLSALMELDRAKEQKKEQGAEVGVH